MTRAVIAGTGRAVPKRILTNDEISHMVDTSDEWIFTRTGIRERRVVGEGESTGTLALDAARMALANARVAPDRIDLVIVATVTPDQPWPSVACDVAHKLGIPGGAAGAFDLSAACAGFVYGLDMAAAQIESGRIRRALVVGADALSRQVDWTDRNTCVLFGDGAGAVVVEAREDTERGLLATVLLSDGSGTPQLGVEVGGNSRPFGSPAAEGHKACIHQNGKEVYRFAVNAMPDACEKAIAKAGMTQDDVDLFVPHQANIRIIKAAAERLGIPWERVFVNLDRYGNTSAATIPIALSEAVEMGRLKEGMTIVTVGFGAGLVWAANVVRW